MLHRRFNFFGGSTTNGFFNKLLGAELSLSAIAEWES